MTLGKNQSIFIIWWINCSLYCRLDWKRRNLPFLNTWHIVINFCIHTPKSSNQVVNLQVMHDTRNRSHFWYIWYFTMSFRLILCFTGIVFVYPHCDFSFALTSNFQLCIFTPYYLQTIMTVIHYRKIVCQTIYQCYKTESPVRLCRLSDLTEKKTCMQLICKGLFRKYVLQSHRRFWQFS